MSSGDYLARDETKEQINTVCKDEEIARLKTQMDEICGINIPYEDKQLHTSTKALMLMHEAHTERICTMIGSQKKE